MVKKSLRSMSRPLWRLTRNGFVGVAGSGSPFLRELPLDEVILKEGEKPHLPDHLNTDNPVGLLAVARGKLRDAVFGLPPDLVMCTEKELKEQFTPTSTDYSLRMSFWREYEAAVRGGPGSTMAAAQVYHGICSDAYFYQKFLKDPVRVAWLIRPVQSYMSEIKAILLKGTERLWELLNIDISYTDKFGKKQVCPKKASVLLDAIKTVESRAQGMPIQRNESKSLAVTVAAADKKKPLIIDATDSQIDQKIRELSAKVLGQSHVTED